MNGKAERNEDIRPNRGIYIRLLLRNRFARKEQSLLFDLFKTFNKIESSYKSDFFLHKRPISHHACATSSELPSNISDIVACPNDAYFAKCRSQ